MSWNCTPPRASSSSEEPGTIIWRERLADGTEAVIKLYRRGLAEWWRGRLGSFRVANEFEALRKLESLGERCTRPLFWGYGNFGSHGRGELLATEWQGDCRPLDELLAADPDARRTLDVTPLWATAGRLHDAGLYHGTFLARNILVRGGAHAPQFILLDMPRCHVFPHGIRGTRMARYDLLFMANTLRRSLPADDVPRWLTAYGMSADQQSRFAAHLRRLSELGAPAPCDRCGIQPARVAGPASPSGGTQALDPDGAGASGILRQPAGCSRSGGTGCPGRSAS